MDAVTQGQSIRSISRGLQMKPVGVFALLAAVLIGLSGLSGCASGPPPGISVVRPFDAKRYLGRWYEIARLDNRFERGLTDIVATYLNRPDGSIDVINRGYDAVQGEWREAHGLAKWAGSPQEGALEVSFFGPFYGGYNVVALDQENYQWSMVIGHDRDYFWILAREKQLDDGLRQSLIRKATDLGIPFDQIIWTPQTRKDN